MLHQEDIIETITNFVKGGDNSDLNLLETVLHKDFKVFSNSFMGTPGVTIIERNQYLENISSGAFGGLPRKMSIEHVDASGSIASVKIRLESEENNFVSYNSLVLDTDGQWKLIHNLAVVQQKK